MAGDDKERPEATKLPRGVERALERARAAVAEDRARKGGRWLAIIPVSVAVVFLVLLMPRATEPEAVPLPYADARALSTVARADDARARATEASRLPSDVLAVGTALRELNGAIAREKEVDVQDARTRLDAAMRGLQRRPNLDEDLLALRAVQERHFLDEVAHFEATGQTSDELVAVAGTFLDRLQEAGWVRDRRVVLTEAQRRVAYKTFWNALTGLEASHVFAPTLDEQRALYTLYLTHPHPAEMRRPDILARRRAASTPEECARADHEEGVAAELWRAEKIKKLAAIDPTYPATYALGVVYFRAGRFDLAADAFRDFVDHHPDGAWSLRARNHLRAAIAAGAP